MKFRKIKRLWTRYVNPSHNLFYVNDDSIFTHDHSVEISNSFVKINGNSSLIVESGCHIVNVRFQIDSNSIVHIGKSANLRDVDICVWNESDVCIGEKVQIDGYNLSINKGHVSIGPDNVLTKGGKIDKPSIIVSAGALLIGDHNNLCNNFWIRFGGVTSLGNYNCINEGSEVRCDESVRIGSYNMISYYCDIWDTNTHSDYSSVEKRADFENTFPRIGLELRKPKTAPVEIGNDNWIGKYACVLKGTIINNNVVIGTRTVASNIHLANDTRLVSAKSVVINKSNNLNDSIVR